MEYALETAVARVVEMQKCCENALDGDDRRLCREARKIYVLAGEVALQLGLNLHSGQPSGSPIRDYIPNVMAEAEQVKRTLRLYTGPRPAAPHIPNASPSPSAWPPIPPVQHTVSEALSRIRCHLALRPSENLGDIISSSSEEASTQAPLPPWTISIAYYPHGGGIKQTTKEFQDQPAFLDLHALAIPFLGESNVEVEVQKFDLKIDSTVLDNFNTKQVLSSLDEKGVRKVLVTLEFIDDRLEGYQRRQGRLEEKFLVCIDGNIGSRKADFMKKLKEINEQSRHAHVVTVIREPLEKLTKQMTAFYGALHAGPAASEEHKKHCSQFEKALFQHHLSVATDPRTSHVISERSMQAKVHVFNQLNLEEGRLSQEAHDEMLQTYDQKIRGRASQEPHAVLFFEISVQQAKASIANRGRAGEEHITEEYLKGIEEKYDKLYPSDAKHVLRLESDHPMEDLLNTIQNELPKILEARSSASRQELDEFMKFFKDLRQHADDQPPN